MRSNGQVDDDNTTAQSQPADDGWQIGNTHASGGIGLDYNPYQGPYYSHLSLQDIPATSEEARKAEFELALNSKWNVSHDIYEYGKYKYLSAFSSDPDAASNYLKQAKDFEDALPEVISSLPSSQKSWTNSWGPSLLGGLADPVTLGAGTLAEQGVKLFAPKVLAAVAEAVPALADTSLKGKVVQGALHGALTGAGGGLLSSAAATALSTPLGYHTNYSEFMGNVLQWTGFGALGGGLGGGLLHFMSPENAAKYDPNTKTPSQEDQNVANSTPLSTNGTIAGQRMAAEQLEAGNNVDASVNLEAQLNEYRGEHQAKIASWQAGLDMAEDKDAYQESHPHPDQQYRDMADAYQEKIDNLHEEAGTIADEIKEHPDYAEDVKSIPLPSLLKGIDSIGYITDTSAEKRPSLEKLSKTLKSKSYLQGPAQVVKKVINTHPDLIDDADKDEIAKLNAPEHELEQLQKIKKFNSDRQGKLIKSRISALKKVVAKSLDERGINPISTKLKRLSDIAEEIDGAKDAKDITLNNLEIANQPITDVESKGREAMRNMSDPNHRWSNDNLQTKVAEDNKDDRPYQVDPRTNDQMDRKIDDLVRAGVLTEADLAEVKELEEQERNDAGEQELNDELKLCIVRNPGEL